jgi:DNA invertase Pin-like site-specific DNA recombinase
MTTKYSKGSILTADDVKKLAEATREHRITEVNPLGGRLTAAERKKRETDSHSLIKYNMREVDNSLPPFHLFLLRLSKDDRNNPGSTSVSIPRQESDICMFARTLGYELDDNNDRGKIDTDRPDVLPLWIEHGSASKNKVRPVFDSMMDFISNFPGANPLHLWVYEPARLTRRTDVAPGLIKTLYERGVVIHIVVCPWIDTQTERGREDLVREFERAESYAKSNSIRQKYAHEYRAGAGFFRGGKAPLGYKNVVLEGQKHPTLVLNEEPRADYPNNWSEVDLVQMLFIKAIEGNSTASMARWLNGLGIPTVKGAKGWDNRTVKQILTNARYAGFQTHKPGKAEWSKFNRDYIVKDHAGNYVQSHVALIKPEDFFAANAVLDTRYQKRRKYTTSRLAGIILCADCGSKMVQGTGARKKGGGRYVLYRCMGKTAGLCVRNGIYADGVERVVREIVTGVLSNPAAKQAMVAKLEAPVEDSEERKELLAMIEDEKQKLEAASKYDKAGIQAKIKAMQDDLAKMDGGRKARTQQAKVAMSELIEFNAAWDDIDKRLGLNLAILAVIREIRIQPRKQGDEILNRYELAKRGWHTNYERVDIMLADGTVIDLDADWAKFLQPVAA